MRDNFQKAIEFVLPWEGYKTDDPRDPGKLTIWGISVVYHPVEVARMVKMSKEEAMKYASKLYLEKYWIPSGCDFLPCPKDMVLFDIAINPGPGLAGSLRAGEGTWQDWLFKRIEYYSNRVKKNPAKLVFLRGWINRTLALRDLIERINDQNH